MLTRDERLRYLEKIEAARTALLADPEIAAEYCQASQAWDSAITPAILEAEAQETESSRQPMPAGPKRR
jgi:hypothetical protein